MKIRNTIKQYNITLRDHVQLLGYRGQIELIGRDLGLHGVVFNAPDGSVKVVAEGEESVFDVFLDELKRIREGVDVEAREVSIDIDLPVPFSRVATNEQLEQMKRFDKGLELLSGIAVNTKSLVEGQNNMIATLGKLDGIDSNTKSLVEGQNNMIATLGKLDGIDSNTKSLVDSQKTLVEGQNKMITILGKIESKLK